jgi:class 3 adenylate cyclase
MKEFLGCRDGDILSALVCFADVAGFARTARSLSLPQIAALCKRISSIVVGHVGNTRGQVVKYIGDASLLVFPEEDADAGVRELLAMKRELDAFLRAEHPALSVSLSAHLGQIIIVELEPIAGLDVLGNTVNIASYLGTRARGAGFVISQEVYERLSEGTRAGFQKQPPAAMYVAE